MLYVLLFQCGLSMSLFTDTYVAEKLLAFFRPFFTAYQVRLEMWLLLSLVVYQCSENSSWRTSHFRNAVV